MELLVLLMSLTYFFSVFQSKVYQENTPIRTTKFKKNPVEVEGMRKAHVSTFRTRLADHCSLIDHETFLFIYLCHQHSVISTLIHGGQ